MGWKKYNDQKRTQAQSIPTRLALNSHDNHIVPFKPPDTTRLARGQPNKQIQAGAEVSRGPAPTR